MNYSVLLVQRGISDGTHAVSGKSGKSYGVAVQTPGFGGVVMKMALDAYTTAADDLIGNTAPMQQWVPHFVSEGIIQATNKTFAGEDRGVCSIPAGCRLGPGGAAAEADYAWQHFKFCAGHAPGNAKPLWEGAPPIYDGNKLAPTGTSDVHPVMIDRGVGRGITEKNGQAPPEVMPAPIVGHENASVGGVERPVAMPVYGGLRRADFQDPAFGQAPPASHEAGSPAADPSPVIAAPQVTTAPPAVRVQTAAELIKQSVKDEVQSLLPAIQEMIKATIPQPQPIVLPPPTPKKVRQAGPPTLFQIAQQRAKDLGMNTWGKKKEELDAYIAEHSNPVGASAAAEAEPNIEF